MDQLREVVAKSFGIPVDSVTDSLSRDNLEAWTSLNHLLLVTDVEEQMGIRLTSDEVLRIHSYKDLREIVSAKLPA
ncbi:MAG TPA: acyl carrier protein [Nitrososphaerales archaeon]|jgi:acyl carrier protein|nr:acyl carrier protein [Nitrososphaerales archaeon]